MATFTLAFITAMFCAYTLNDAGHPVLAMLVAGLIGLASGAFFGMMEDE